VASVKTFTARCKSARVSGYRTYPSGKSKRLSDANALNILNSGTRLKDACPLLPGVFNTRNGMARYALLCLALLLCLLLPGRLPAQGPPSPAPGQTAPPKLPPEVQKVADQYSKAVKLHQDKQYKEALAAYKEYVRLVKAANLSAQVLLPAYHNMVAIYEYLIAQQQDVVQNTQELEATLREIAHVDPNNAGVQAQLALITSQSRRVDEARHFANRALQLKPDNTVAGTAHFVLGNLAAIQRDYPTSSREFGAATKLMPKNPLAFFNYGLSLAEEKKYKEALTAFEQARKLDPKVNNVDAYIAAVKQELNKGDDALTEYDKILKSDPHNAHALLNRAYLLDQKGQKSAAISAYLDALAVVPNDYDAHFNVARLYEEIRNFTASRQHYLLAHQSVAGKDNARDARALVGAAASELQEGSGLLDTNQRQALLSAAEQHYKQAIAFSPKDNTLVFQLGEMYEKLARYDDARALYRKQLELMPNESLLYRHLANVSLMQRNPPEFIKTWQSYQQKFPDDPVSYQQISSLYDKMGQWNQAIAEWNLLLARKPGTSMVANALTSIAQDQIQLRHYDEARKQYQATLALDDKAVNVPKSSQASEIAGIQAAQVRALRGLSEVAQAENKPDEALQWLEQVRTRESEIFHKAGQPINPQIYHDIALLYEQTHKPDLAIKTYLELTQALPNDYRPYEELGRLYAAQNQLDRAVAAYQKAASFPNHPNPISERLKIAQLYQRQAQTDKRYFDKAIDEYEAIRVESPKDKQVLTELAQVYRQAGQDTKALAIYDALQGLDPTLRWVDDAKAVVLTNLKRYDDARALYIRQITRDPENRQNYANLANLWAKEGKREGFIDWVKPRFEKTPSNLTLMGVTLDEYTRQKREEEGWAYLKSVIEKNSAQRPVLEAYANLLELRQKRAESLAVYRRIAEANPSDISAQSQLADQLDFNNQKEEANQVYVALIARTDVPDTVRQSVRRQLGARYARQAKWADAVAQYQELVKQNAKDFDAAMTLGTILVQAGREADAIALYAKVLTEKDFPAVVYVDAHNRLGALYEKQNNKPEAIRQYQEALKLDKDDTIATDGLKRLDMKQG